MRLLIMKQHIARKIACLTIYYHFESKPSPSALNSLIPCRSHIRFHTTKVHWDTNPNHPYLSVISCSCTVMLRHLASAIWLAPTLSKASTLLVSCCSTSLRRELRSWMLRRKSSMPWRLLGHGMGQIAMRCKQSPKLTIAKSRHDDSSVQSLWLVQNPSQCLLAKGPEPTAVHWQGFQEDTQVSAGKTLPVWWFQRLRQRRNWSSGDTTRKKTEMRWGPYPLSSMTLRLTRIESTGR